MPFNDDLYIRRMRIFLIDDHQMFSEAMKTVLNRILPACETELFSRPEDALVRLQHQKPDLIILDLEMATMSGVDLLRVLPQHSEAIPVLVCSGNLTAENIALIRNAGASGYMRKTESIEEVKTAIEAVSAGKPYPEDFHCETSTPENSVLSRRQLAILTLMKAGMSNLDIAETLYLSPNTIKTHIRLMYNTLDVTSRVECLNKASSLGLI